MKKTLSTLVLAASLFVAACGAAPEYDFSGGEKFMASVQAQAKAEGISEADANALIGAYTVILLQDKTEEMETIPVEEREAYTMAIFEKNMKGKTLTEVVDIISKATE